VAIGKDLSLEESMAKYDAVFLAVGAWKEAVMGNPRRRIDGARTGIPEKSQFGIKTSIW